MHSLFLPGSIIQWKQEALVHEAEQERLALRVRYEELSLCLPGGWCLIRRRPA